MKENFDFRGLFVLDLANNHQGSVEHGLTVISSMADVVKKHGVKAAMKFQFRQLDSFIHKAHRNDAGHKHIGRFLSTRLSRGEFERLFQEVKAQGLISMCTPFDEASVGVIADMGFEIVKVASCSAKDWPLLEEVAGSNLPVVFSTGGLTLDDIDNVVSFFDHRGVDFAIMHCVSIYPSPDEYLQLNQITKLRTRYPGRVVGWSTHENPDDTMPVGIAVAKGSEMFERHVGVATDQVKLNAYSSTPEQLDAWMSAYWRAKTMCGASSRPEVPAEESASMDSLRRGVYVRTPVKRGESMTRDQVYFAIPYHDGQMESGQWRDGVVATSPVSADAPLLSDQVRIPSEPEVKVLKRAIHEVKALLNEAGIALNSQFKTEYSHHYGIRNFRETGAVLIECVNRDYCKKLLVQLPGQRHPNHYHGLKEETFQVLYGELYLTIDNKEHKMMPGETMLIQPGVWHSFRTETGAVVEEISTTHHNNDSFYQDKSINQMKRSARKTVVDHWGRFQLEPDKVPVST